MSVVNTFKEIWMFYHNNLSNNINNEEIENNLDDFYNLLNNACNPFLRKKLNKPLGYNKNKQPWFDDDCSIHRGELYNNLKKYRNYSTDDNRHDMTSSTSKCTSIIRSKKRQFDKQKTEQLQC